MNERRTAKAKVNLVKTVFLVMAILIICSGWAAAQQSFRDLAKEYGHDWLAGRWTATTGDGSKILLVYKWELNGHLITVDFKMGEYASRGMMFYVPGEEKVVQVGVDNRGGRSKGIWDAQDGKLVSKSEYVDAEGNVRKSASVYTKVDAKTIKIALYGLDEDGELGDEPWFTMDFKREEVNKTGKATDTPAGESQKKSN
ncbi:MAG: hypothetical protein ACYS6W_01485 [Planctomycetota bacterium]|jgi:hypothetical protein